MADARTLRRAALIGAPLAAAALAAALLLADGGAEGDPVRGAALYAEACASCHGAALEGQPDWMERGPDGRLPAPPHDASGHTWHHSDRVLFRIVKEGTEAVVGGGYESDMPGFGDSLTDAEIRDVLAFIKSRWPERERAYQAQVSEQDADG